MWDKQNFNFQFSWKTFHNYNYNGGGIRRSSHESWLIFFFFSPTSIHLFIICRNLGKKLRNLQVWHCSYHVWPDCCTSYSIFDHLKRSKCYTTAFKIGKSWFNIVPNAFKTPLNDQRLLKLCQSGEISPNLVTLFISLYYYHYSLLFLLNFCSNDLSEN